MRLRVKIEINLVDIDDVTIKRLHNFEKQEQIHDNNGYVDKVEVPEAD